MARIDLELQELIDIAKNNKPVWHNVSDNRFDLDKVYLVSDGVKQWFGYFRDIGTDEEFDPHCFNRDSNELIPATIYTELPELPSE